MSLEEESWQPSTPEMDEDVVVEVWQPRTPNSPDNANISYNPPTPTGEFSSEELSSYNPPTPITITEVTDIDEIPTEEFRSSSSQSGGVGGVGGVSARRQLRQQERKRGILSASKGSSKAAKKSQDATKVDNMTEAEKILKEAIGFCDCQTCLRTMYRPVTLPCGHTFCSFCIFKSEQLCKSPKLLCSVCRTQVLHGFQFKVSISLQNCAMVMLGESKYEQLGLEQVQDECKAFPVTYTPDRPKWTDSCVQLAQLITSCLIYRGELCMGLNQCHWKTTLTAAQARLPDLKIFVGKPKKDPVWGDFHVCDIQIPFGLTSHVLYARSELASQLTLSDKDLLTCFWEIFYK